MHQQHPLRVLALLEASTVTGPAKNLMEFARRARRAEGALPAVDVAIATYLRGAAPEPNPFMRAAQEAGLAVEVIPERRRFDLGVLAQLRALVDRHRPDILQSHHCKSHFLVRLTGLGRTLPWVAFHHGYTAGDLKVRCYNQLDRISLPAARHIVTVCGAFAVQIQRYGIPAQRISVLHNMVHPFRPPTPESVSALRARYDLPENAAVVLAVGRLSREKGHVDLIEAAARLRRHHPDLPLRVVLVGEGPERAVIQARVAAQGLDGAVVLCGHQADVAPFYALATVVALPSHSEGSPNVLLEAMAAGIPVVATAVGGVPEIATDQVTALLVSRGNHQAMAEALARLLREPELARRLARQAQAEVLARYTPEAYRRTLTQLYERVLAGLAPSGP
ncbi:MAG: glycosyltransferase [Acidobacteria bacterium]|nr:glycosyltransferase [Acidobacteriota bacterium]